MLARSQLSEILRNESLTRGLADPEARVLVEWLVERAEELAEGNVADDALEEALRRLCCRARAIARFVWLWCHTGDTAGAVQLAGSQRFTWPLPSTTALDPCELMQFIVACEEEAQPLAA